jgi:hypothetical protein
MTNLISHKNKGVVYERQGQLDLLFEFANTDLDQPASDHLGNRILALIDGAITPLPGGHKVLRAFEYSALLPEIQKHLRRRFNKIMRKTTFLVEMPLWKITGSLEFTVEGSAKRFRQRIQLRKVKEGNEIKVLKQAVDLALMLIIQDLNFRPDRFQRCPRCKVYFYQPTDRLKQYCSTRCNDAVRLERFKKQKKLA